MFPTFILDKSCILVIRVDSEVCKLFSNLDKGYTGSLVFEKYASWNGLNKILQFSNYIMKMLHTIYMFSLLDISDFISHNTPLADSPPSLKLETFDDPPIFSSNMRLVMNHPPYLKHDSC